MTAHYSATWVNLYDAFFRIFSGNTQVSATEARALPMPELGLIEEIGRRVLGAGDGDAELIVNNVLDYEPQLV